MDIQFYGANCATITYKGTRLVVDDNLAQLGAKTITKGDDIALFTNVYEPTDAKPRLVFDQPGEYEVGDVSIVGIAAQAHMDEAGAKTATMFKVMAGEFTVLLVGHIHPDVANKTFEDIGMVDVLLIPVGGNGYTLDAVGASKIIKEVEPKLVVPTHYEEKGLTYPVPQQSLAQALKELSMEPRDTVNKLRLKPGELADITQLVVLERS